MSKTQNEEIVTIKERDICIKLSEADIERLFKKAGAVGFTVSELLANFIGDLVGGTYSNGSDERMYANMWFERCWFSMGLGEVHFLQWLIEYDDVESVVSDWNDLQMLKEQKDLDGFDEYDKQDMTTIGESLRSLFEDYQKSKRAIKDSTLEGEMIIVVKWHNEMQKMKG